MGLRFNKLFLSGALCIGLCVAVQGQSNILSKKIALLEIKNQRLTDVLEILSNKGNFYFSYNSSIIKKDSLVSFTAFNKSVKDILIYLFKETCEYRESGNYLILRRAPVNITIITNKAVTEDKFYFITGYVLNDQTGEKINEASVYEKQRLASTITNQDGYFKIRLKSKYKRASLSVSKEFYEDTTVSIDPKYNQQIAITIVPVDTEAGNTIVAPEDYLAPDKIVLTTETDSFFTAYRYDKTDSVKVEKTKIGQFLFSAKQKIESVNLKKFFVVRPYQISLLPPISTNGGLNAQVINKFSLNIWGGYSAGVRGAEFGGIFNINKKNMHGYQNAGIFNLVGGHVQGVQLAGNTNVVLENLYGLQAAGINNFVKRKVTGVQFSGIHNHAGDTLSGAQFAGITNFTNKKTTGLQVAGIGNFSRRNFTGIQAAGIFNYAGMLHGLQVGLVNVADSSNGYSFGLLNIVRKNGYRKISVSTNELAAVNVEIKTGNAKMYCILMGGINISDSAKLYSYGFGVGHDFPFSKKISISVSASAQYIYLGNRTGTNILNSLKPSVNLHLSKGISIFAGPSLNIYYSNQTAAEAGYKKIIPTANYGSFNVSKKVNGWIGWQLGITLF